MTFNTVACTVKCYCEAYHSNVVASFTYKLTDIIMIAMFSFYTFDTKCQMYRKFEHKNTFVLQNLV